MGRSTAGTHLYTVVEVSAGVATAAYCFARLKEARVCARRLSKGRDLQEDDVQVFRVVVGTSCEPVALDGD